MSPETLHNIKLLAPEAFLTLVLCFLFVMDGLFPKIRTNKFSMLTTVVGCICAILLTCKVGKHQGVYFGGMFVTNVKTPDMGLEKRTQGALGVNWGA